MAKTKLIPRELIFGNPERAEPKIAPNGKMMAYLAPLDGVLNVWVGSVGGDDFRPVTRDTDRGIRVYFWAHDSKHLMYLQDVGGDENWRLHKVDPDSESVEDLTPFDDVQVQIVEHDKHHPNDILLGINKDDVRFHDVYHLDLTTNLLDLVAKNPGNVMSWVADAGLQVRAAVTFTPDGGSELLVRDSDQSEWHPLIAWSPEDALTSGPLGFTLDGTSLYLIDSQDANAARLARFDLASQIREVVAGDPEYDVGGAMVHPDTREIQMVSFVKARTEHVVLDDAIDDDVAAIRQLNPGDFSIYDRTHRDDVWLVGFTEADRPVSYYAYDLKTKEGTFLFYNRPALADYQLATMEPISFASRDGLTVHGYLSLPPDTVAGASAPTPLPMVLNVHGGPWHRDVWGYDPETQWLVNRGYACLQVNYRGSTGYGKKFLNAGTKEWGGKMHDDLVDAVRWAVDQGIADPGRIAIYGGSYGGYAALVGATFTPDLFTCAVDIVGPSNLITFIQTIPPYWTSYLAMLQERVGNPETEAEFLESRSPLSYVDRIRIPMLIAQGANDPRVKQSESEQIVAAMKEKGIDHEYLLFHDEGHGFVKPENRLEFYARAERFLAKYLGGRYEDERMIS